MAEFLMKEAVKRLGCADSFEIGSCAGSTEELGNPPYPPVRALMKSLGIDVSAHRARLITAADLRENDQILIMDRENLWLLKDLFPHEPLNNVRPLLSCCGDNADIADPWYTRDFRAAMDDIIRGIRGLLGELPETAGFSAADLDKAVAFKPR